MTWTNQRTFLYRDTVAWRATAPAQKIAFVSFRSIDATTSRRVVDFEPEPSSVHVISPADAVKRYWRWDNMPETMRRLA